VERETNLKMAECLHKPGQCLQGAESGDSLNNQRLPSQGRPITAIAEETGLKMMDCLHLISGLDKQKVGRGDSLKMTDVYSRQVKASRRWGEETA
jgi:hypothetical protein